MPKFTAGQTVYFESAGMGRNATKGAYKIIRVLPLENDSEYRYRVKSNAEAYERVAKESQLTGDL
jgi:hypothetical protein